MSEHDEAPSAAVQELLDKQAITEILYRYCRGVDRLDWHLVRGCYHDGAIDDHGYFRITAEEFVDHVRRPTEEGFAATVHSLSNILIKVDGDVAGSEAHARVWHLLKTEGEPDRAWIAGLRYVDRMERRRGEWRIAYRTLVWSYSVLEPIGERRDLGPATTWSRRDTGDVSYRVLGEKIDDPVSS